MHKYQQAKSITSEKKNKIIAWLAYERNNTRLDSTKTEKKQKGHF